MPTRSRVWRWVSVVAFVVCLGFVAIAFRTSLERAEGRAVPNAAAVACAAGVAVMAHVLATRAWRLLLPRHLDPVLVARTWYVTQVAKYVPGGFAQATGQIALTQRVGASWPTATLAYVVLAGGYIVSGLWLGSGVVVLGDDLSPWLRALTAVGFVLPIVMWRPVMAWGLHLVRRVITRLPPPEALPSQGDLLLSWAAQLAFMAGLSGAFTILLRSLDSDAPLALTLCAFPLAFSLGTMAVPVPSGLAVREAALVGLLSGSVDAELVIAASVWLRLVTIVVELALIGANHVHLAVLRSPAGSAFGHAGGQAAGGADRYGSSP